MSPETFCSNHPEVLRSREQFDKEIKQLLEKTAGLEANMMHVIAALGRLEKNLESRFEKVEKEQEKQRVADVAHEKEMAVVTTKTNVVWDFLWNRGGFALIIVLAYVVLGQRV